MNEFNDMEAVSPGVTKMVEKVINKIESEMKDSSEVRESTSSKIECEGKMSEKIDADSKPVLNGTDKQKDDSNDQRVSIIKTRKRLRTENPDFSEPLPAPLRNDEESPKKRKRDSTYQPPKLKGDVDIFCWRCHKDGSSIISCRICPRVFHTRCARLETPPSNDWICHECATVLRAENAETRSEALKSLSIEQFSKLLRFVIQRMRYHDGSAHFDSPVDLKEYPQYRDFVIKPIDLTMLENNIKNLMYGSTEAFLADTKWLVHNSIIFNSVHSELTTFARALVKIAKQETEEIENCPDCYKHAHTLKENLWFIEPCRRPHILVWAKLKGFPYWPGKVMRSVGNTVDVRFFGDHNRAWVTTEFCCLYSKEIPATAKNRKLHNLDSCVQEVEDHIKKLQNKYRRFSYFPFRTVYNPKKHNELLAEMFPDYDESAAMMSDTKEPAAVDEFVGGLRKIELTIGPTVTDLSKDLEEKNDAAPKDESPVAKKQKLDKNSISNSLPLDPTGKEPNTPKNIKTPSGKLRSGSGNVDVKKQVRPGGAAEKELQDNTKKASNNSVSDIKKVLKSGNGARRGIKSRSPVEKDTQKEAGHTPQINAKKKECNSSEIGSKPGPGDLTDTGVQEELKPINNQKSGRGDNNIKNSLMNGSPQEDVTSEKSSNTVLEKKMESEHVTTLKTSNIDSMAKHEQDDVNGSPQAEKDICEEVNKISQEGPCSPILPKEPRVVLCKLDEEVISDYTKDRLGSLPKRRLSRESVAKIFGVDDGPGLSPLSVPGSQPVSEEDVRLKDEGQCESAEPSPSATADGTNDLAGGAAEPLENVVKVLGPDPSKDAATVVGTSSPPIIKPYLAKKQHEDLRAKAVYRATLKKYGLNYKRKPLLTPLSQPPKLTAPRVTPTTDDDDVPLELEISFDDGSTVGEEESPMSHNPDFGFGLRGELVPPLFLPKDEHHSFTLDCEQQQQQSIQQTQFFCNAPYVGSVTLNDISNDNWDREHEEIFSEGLCDKDTELTIDDIISAVKEVNTKEEIITVLEERLTHLDFLHRTKLRVLHKITSQKTKEMMMHMKRELKDDFERMKQEVEEEAFISIEKIKRKQWCHLCLSEAKFHCCFGANYCDVSCQEADWPNHMHVCTQYKMRAGDPDIRLSPSFKKLFRAHFTKTRQGEVSNDSMAQDLATIQDLVGSSGSVPRLQVASHTSPSPPPPQDETTGGSSNANSNGGHLGTCNPTQQQVLLQIQPQLQKVDRQVMLSTIEQQQCHELKQHKIKEHQKTEGVKAGIFKVPNSPPRKLPAANKQDSDVNRRMYLNDVAVIQENGATNCIILRNGTDGRKPTTGLNRIRCHNSGRGVKAKPGNLPSNMKYAVRHTELPQMVMSTPKKIAQSRQQHQSNVLIKSSPQPATQLILNTTSNNASQLVLTVSTTTASSQSPSGAPKLVITGNSPSPTTPQLILPNTTMTTQTSLFTNTTAMAPVSLSGQLVIQDQASTNTTTQLVLQNTSMTTQTPPMVTTTENTPVALSGQLVIQGPASTIVPPTSDVVTQTSSKVIKGADSGTAVMSQASVSPSGTQLVLPCLKTAHPNSVKVTQPVVTPSSAEASAQLLVVKGQAQPQFLRMDMLANRIR